MMKKLRILVLVALVPQLLLAGGHGSCPSLCSCNLDIKGRREVKCDAGNLRDPLPVMDMPSDTEVIIVDAPDGVHNTLTLGPIFKRFKKLEIITVSRSRVPAIGEHSFWGLRYLHTLNISRNGITSLVTANFRGPEELKILDISRNLIESMPSAVFRYAKKLKTLNLAHNRLPELVPRVFYDLLHLNSLDLSYNPLGTLPGMVFTDVQNLKELKCVSCGLMVVSEDLFEALPNLEHLDLSSNRLTAIPPISKCRYLSTLMLSGNIITMVSETAFSGLPLYGLSLSHNRIKHVHPKSFRNISTLKVLDMSYNRLGLFDVETVIPVKSDALVNADIETSSNFVGEREAEILPQPYSGTLEFITPVASLLRRLILSGNFLQLSDIQPIMQLVRQIRFLALGDVGLTKIPSEFLQHARHLRVLNVSGNSLSNFPNYLLYSTPHLHSLYLDHNNFRGMSDELVSAFAAMRSLQTIRLEGNPWQCDKCQVSAMISWLQSTPHQPHSSATCRTAAGSHLCLRCVGPSPMEGLELVLLRDEELPDCGMTDSSGWPAWLGRGSISHSHHPRVMGVGTGKGVSDKDLTMSEGSVAAFFRDHLALLVGVGCGLVLALLIVVMVAVIIVRRHSALYYTAEEEMERQEKLVGRNNNDSPVSRTTQTTPSPTPVKIVPYQPMAISRVHARNPITTSTFRSPNRLGSSSISTIDEGSTLNTAT